MRTPRIQIGWLLGALALPIMLASGCSTGPGVQVTELQRIENKEDGPAVPIDPASTYRVSIQDLQLEGATGDPGSTPRLIINLNDRFTNPCPADRIECYQTPDNFGGDRFSGDELQNPQRFTVRDPDADDSSPDYGVLGDVIGAVTGTGTFSVKVQTHHFQITGVTFTYRVRF